MRHDQISIVLFICLLVSFSQCSKTDVKKDDSKNVAGNYNVAVSSESKNVCWDPPSQNSDSVKSYELFYRSASDVEWIILKSNIPAAQSPCVTIFRNDLNLTDSVFYFAVRSVGKNGMRSEMHESGDDDAAPPNWQIMWKNK